MEQNEMPKVRTSWLAQAAIVCLAAMAVGVAIAMALAFVGLGRVAEAIVGVLALIACPFAAMALGIAGMIVIARSNGRLGGTRLAVGTVLVSTFFVMFATVMVVIGEQVTIPYQVMCRANMKGIGNAMLVYMQDHKGELPEPARWCDLLVMKADISPASFRCRASGAEKGECSYALNKAVVGRKVSELKADMVILFEVLPDEDAPKVPLASRAFARDPNCEYKTADATNMVRESMWNQVCGPEHLDVTTHKGGCNVLFWDMTVKFIDAETLPKLKWSLDEGFVFPKIRLARPEPRLSPEAKKVMIVTIAALAVMATGLLMWNYRGKAERHSHLTLATLGAVCGVLMGFLSQGLHNLPHDSESVGAIVGALTGLLAGLAYASLVTATIGGIEKSSDRMRYAAAVGMVTGVICSLIVHSVLLLMSMDIGDGMPLVAGIPFGVFAGGVVGVIAGHLMEDSEKPATISETIDE